MKLFIIIKIKNSIHPTGDVAELMRKIFGKLRERKEAAEVIKKKRIS